MRDPERIDEFLSEFAVYWKQYPDLRFGQLVCVLQKYVGNDLFYYEEDQLIELMTKMFGRTNG